MQKYSKNIKLPYHKAEDLLKMRRLENELMLELNRKPNYSEIAAKSNFKKDYVEKLMSLNVETKSLFDPVDSQDEQSRGLLEVVADNRHIAPQDSICR